MLHIFKWPLGSLLKFDSHGHISPHFSILNRKDWDRELPLLTSHFPVHPVLSHTFMDRDKSLAEKRMGKHLYGAKWSRRRFEDFNRGWKLSLGCNKPLTQTAPSTSRPPLYLLPSTCAAGTHPWHCTVSNSVSFLRDLHPTADAELSFMLQDLLARIFK